MCLLALHDEPLAASLSVIDSLRVYPLASGSTATVEASLSSGTEDVMARLEVSGWSKGGGRLRLGVRVCSGQKL